MTCNKHLGLLYFWFQDQQYKERKGFGIDLSRSCHFTLTTGTQFSPKVKREITKAEFYRFIIAGPYKVLGECGGCNLKVSKSRNVLLVSPNRQKNKEFFLWIFALATKKRSIQKNIVKESKQNHPISCIKCPYFLISPLLRG